MLALVENFRLEWRGGSGGMCYSGSEYSRIFEGSIFEGIYGFLVSSSSAAACRDDSLVSPRLVPRDSSVLAKLCEVYMPLSIATTIFALALSFYLYITSFSKDKVLADGGTSGNVVYDFFMGRELNPRIGSLDLKEFFELKPGLIGWTVLNISFVCKFREENGHVPLGMAVLALFQGLYTWDALYHEKAILTTMDITQDGFGFMLAYGDVGWVPFTYTLQSNYLLRRDPSLSNITLFLIFCLNCVGYGIFRGSNSEKDAFRRDPDGSQVSHLKFIETRSGRKLLISGWWGIARKINYTGDWIMGLCWCMLTGFNTVVTYFYAAYFAVLLIHRSFRDDKMCKDKYGEDWNKYKSIVKYKFVPGIF